MGNNDISLKCAQVAMWVVKLLLAACLLTGLLFPGIPGVEGKGWPERAVGYPLSALIVPIVWFFSRRSQTRNAASGSPASTSTAPPSTYPYHGDALLVTPFVLDLAGNLVNLYDTFDQFDDVLHFLNWTFLVAAMVLFLRPAKLKRWNLVLLGSGFGALAIVAWEGVEWIIQEMGTAGLELTYDDTVGDLVLSTSGGILGAALAAVVLTRRESPN
ncbi:MAG TPA: hypothetical protein DF783_02550 [Acidimicrobiaceae bacterium]|jgi:hypothetical protein|nr:hypothetical protein [Acidimicrobiaceae bacterium]HCV35777.1 hypothetical protein [Acidimicrobiaceae bacterium]HJO80562.1 hypothetical protein [Acidimicrobiales bacterium]|tara:strand:+ start:8895 stop:9539 length:645 start_codon:yes stop_codon:yes gene_type:complete